ncbi:MAG: acyltransferase [Hyphomicrobiales bacterium]|nr:acyltransferase [Hyphomicrobiales bacterium]
MTPAPFSAASEARFAEFDGVRGVAIALTLLSNTVVVAWDAGAGAKLWIAAAGAGWIGVQLFFVLSGFLITGILLEARGEAHYFRNFYARRALRILPVYVATLLAAGAINWAGLNAPTHHPACYWLFVSNICIAATGEWDALLGVTWSLAVEEQFYILWPFLVAFVAPRRFIHATVAVIVLTFAARFAMLALGYSAASLYVLPLTRFDGLAAGALCAALIHRGVEGALLGQAGRALLAGGCAVMAGVAVATHNFNSHEPLVMALGYPGLTAAATGFVLLLAAEPDRGSLWRRGMKWPPLVVFGFYSYAMYLYHPFIIGGWRISGLMERWPFSLADGLVGQAAATAITAAGAFALAWVSWRVMESRLLALRRHFPRKAAINGSASPPVAAAA